MTESRSRNTFLNLFYLTDFTVKHYSGRCKAMAKHEVTWALSVWVLALFQILCQILFLHCVQKCLNPNLGLIV